MVSWLRLCTREELNHGAPKSLLAQIQRLEALGVSSADRLKTTLASITTEASPEFAEELLRATFPNSHTSSGSAPRRTKNKGKAKPAPSGGVPPDTLQRSPTAHNVSCHAQRPPPFCDRCGETGHPSNSCPVFPRPRARHEDAHSRGTGQHRSHMDIQQIMTVSALAEPPRGTTIV